MLNKIIRLVKYQYRYLQACYYCTQNNLKPPWKILFFGTDDFSLASLRTLNCVYKKGNLINNLEVVTSIKPKKNQVETFAIKEKLVVHGWPIDPSNCSRFHIGFVVSFGHLIPETIISAFPLGMLNVHASLLPRWRGAAPIIYAIANGDKQTGVTVMKIKPDKFDVGEVVLQSSVVIPEDVKMPDLYVMLANLGAETLIQTLNRLPEYLANAKPQPNVGITLAPRVHSKISQVNWSSMTAQDVYNLHRALTGMFELTTFLNKLPIKLSDVRLCSNESLSTKIVPGFVKYCKKQKCLHVQCKDGNWISVEKVGIPGKKMTAADFNNGFLNKEKIDFRIFR